MAQKDTLDYQAQISTLQTEMNGQREKLESQRRKGEDLHSQLAAAEESSRRLQEELVQCAALREETERLRRSEASLLAQIAVLNELKERTSAIPNLEVTLSVKEAEVERLNREIRSFKVLEQALSVKNGEMGELRKELDTANAKLNAVQMTSYDCARLEREIVDARKLLESEKEIRNRAIGEKEGCQKRLNEVEKELRAQLASAELKLQRSNTRFETLELQLTERDDASSALQSELKERLQTCESRLQLSNRDLLAATSHAALLEKTVQDLQKTLVNPSTMYELSSINLLSSEQEIQLEEMQNMKDASEARLAELSATNELLFRAQNELESQTSALLRETAANEELKKQVEEARNMRSGIVKSMEETTVLSRMSQEELLEAQRTVSVLQRELSGIRGQLEQFQQRMSTLPTRCTNTSELNAEEAALVGKLMFVCRSFYEKELAEKGNSIRRRDNTIKEKDSHIKELEELLAKPQVPVVETCGTECSNSITTASVDPLTTLASLSQVNNDVPKDNTAPHSSTSQSNREASTTKPNRQPLLAALDRQSSQEQYLVPSSDDASRITLKTTCPSTVTAKKPDTSDKKRSKRSIDDSDYVDDEDVEVAQKRGKRGKMIESRRHSAQAEKAIAKQRTRRRH
ncbi:hypothetical protein FRC03_002401 [Tulasnella sp. 419]|nr:hypothetical protein FRC03_002401 [Tulasnella sp. 419]